MELKRSSVVTFFDFNVSFVRHELQSLWTMLDAIVILSGTDGAKNRSTIYKIQNQSLSQICRFICSQDFSQHF